MSRYLFFVLFSISGLSALIYESIWTRYLKLFLGHAAYAQTLVLAIFMGGMAIGAWLAGKHSQRWRSLLLSYAVVEGIIGVLALGFHSAFVFLIDKAHFEIIPALGSVALVHAFQWSAAALLILPQSILLGMTFPLMCGGVLRRYPSDPGRSVATLYFCNSLGAAIGVLIAGFWLVSKFGLPGTILTAGLMNIVLALVAWLSVRSGIGDGPANAPRLSRAIVEQPSWYRPLLLIAAVTGLSSFIYEIAWIRMLSMVLGSATHSFELMLSAFILGLALGSLWVRRHIDRARDSLGFLAFVQIAMGMLALFTLVAYGSTFEAMKWILGAVNRSDNGYVVFMLVSHAIAFGIMFPATFCAGMTLPLITHTLIQRGAGERAIGSVYAANTMGAILGVFFAVHIAMPMLGLKGAISVGAALDIGIGLIILWVLRSARSRVVLSASAMVGIGALVTTLLWVQLDPRKMASGVYRYAHATLPESTEILFHRDGKTATVNLAKNPDGVVIISTNGKPDASIAIASPNTPSPDEVTMALAGALPIALRPQARTAANIGMGSGLTTHTLLSSPRLEAVDTIEIEAAMVEGAKGFGSRVERAFSDPRSKIYIDDAKTFFSSHNKRYDIIVSEPSNPWVSGVASLFSDEFYRVIRRHLTPNGVLVQWLQVYEIDMSLMASVVKAMSRHFSDYVIYTTDSSNILVLTTNGTPLGEPDDYIFEEGALAAELRRANINYMGDLTIRRIGSRTALDPLFQSYGVPVNSDFFPFVELNAPKARFQNRDAVALVSLPLAPIPFLQVLDKTNDGVMGPQVTTDGSSFIDVARRLQRYLVDGNIEDIQTSVPENLQTHAVLLVEKGQRCSASYEKKLWLRSLFRVTNAVGPYLSSTHARAFWEKIERSACVGELSDEERKWFSLLKAVHMKDLDEVPSIARQLLESEQIRSDQEVFGYVCASAMLAHLAKGDPVRALKVWSEFVVPHLIGSGSPNMDLRLLHAHAKADCEAKRCLTAVAPAAQKSGNQGSRFTNAEL